MSVIGQMRVVAIETVPCCGGCGCHTFQLVFHGGSRLKVSEEVARKVHTRMRGPEADYFDPGSKACYYYKEKAVDMDVVFP